MKDEVTLRYQFAMAALTGLLSRPIGELTDGYGEFYRDEIVKRAFVIADAMIEERTA